MLAVSARVLEERARKGEAEAEEGGRVGMRGVLRGLSRVLEREGG